MKVEFYGKMLLELINRKLFFLFIVMIALTQISNAQTPATGLGFTRSGSTGYNYVDVAVDPVLNISHQITIETWINPSFPLGVQDVISKSSSAANSGYIFPRTVDGWNNVEFLIYINGQGWQKLSVPYVNNTSTTIGLNEWHHLAATYDGYTMNIYIDGNLSGTKNFSGTIAVNNNNLTISGQTGYIDEFFSGKVDDVRIWNRALTQCEISAGMSCELSGAQTGLAAYFKMNQGIIGGNNSAITTVTDASGNNLQATLTYLTSKGGTTPPVWTDGIVTGTCSVFTPITATASSVKANLAIGSTIELLASGGGATGTYSWVGPNGFTSNLQNPTIPGAGLNASGVYTVTVSNGGCSATASVTITVAESGGALDFDGLDNYVTIPNSPSLNPTKNLTIEAWIRPTSSSPTVQNVLSKSTDQVNNGYIFPRTDDGWASFSFWLTINGQWRVISAPYLSNTTVAINLNEWHHLSATYDGFFMKIYLDGVLVNSLAITGTITPNGNDITLGIQQGKLEYFKGQLDELRVWNRTLAQCEIQNNLYCELNGDKTISNPLGLAAQTGLAAYYRFNQGLANVNNAGTGILADSSGNGNNGTLVGFTLAGTNSNWVPGKATGTCALYTSTQPVVTNNGPIIEVGTTLQMAVNTGTTFSWTGPNNFTSNQQSISIPNAQTVNSGTYTVSVTGNACTSVVGTNVTVAYRAGTLDFDGVNDMVTVPENSKLDIKNTITLESWVYARSGANNNSTQDVLCKSSQNYNTGYIFPRTDDSWSSFVFYLHINGQWEKLSAPYGLMDSWHHMAATYDGYYMRIYLDGALAASKLVSGTIDTDVANNLVVGQQPGFNEFFHGQLEESRIWSRALNQCEIINNMNCEVNPSSNPDLVAYYKYNQGFVNVDNFATTTLQDATANANNGTLNNFGLVGLSSNWTAYKINGSCTAFTLPPVTVSANGTIFGVGSTVKLFTFGGESGQGYAWDGPAGFTSTLQNPNITNAQINQSGVYTVTVPFVKCSVTASTRIDVSPLDPIHADGPTTFCPSSSVTLSTTAIGTSYQWYLNDVLIPGATSKTYLATQGGSYSVSVTNGKVILVTVPIQITVVDNLPPVPDQPTLPVLNLSTPAVVTTVPTATDNCRGVIRGVTSSPLSFDVPGTYNITWTYDDQNGHVVSQNQQVIVVLGVDLTPPALTVPADITLSANVTSCGAVANFTATATDNSLLPVTITYSQDPGTVFPVGDNIVTVTAVDQSLNTTTKTFVIHVLPTIVAPIQGNTVICAGQTTTLTDATAGGSWNTLNSAVATVDASGVVTGISAGTATIQYTNACGVSSSIVVTVNGLPVTTVTANSATTFCAGGTVNLSVGAVSGNTYQWYNGASLIANANSATYAATASGDYTVTVSNSNGCSATSAPTRVTVNPLPQATVTAGSNTTFCAGGSVVLTAANQSGNTYQWYNGANAITNETNAAYTANTSGNYSVVVSNNGCQSTSAVIAVTANPLPVANVTAGSSTTFCEGGSVVLTVANQSGNTYQWYNGANLLTNATSNSFTATAAGNYSVVVSNNGCQTTSSSIPVTVNPLPVAIVNPASSTTFCVGGSVTLATANQSGYTYQWYNNNTAITNANAATYTASNTGSYQVKVTNASGCQSTSAATNVTVNAITVPVISAASSTNFCVGGSVTLSVPAVTGASYQWYNGSNLIASANSNSYTATATGNYSVNLTNNSGCQSLSNTIAVTVNAAPQVPIITAGTSTTFCAGGSVTLDAGYQSGVTYQWYNGNTSIGGATSKMYTAAASGSYRVTLTNINGCVSGSTATQVVVNVVPVATIAVSSPDAFCNKVKLNAGSLNSVPNTTYQWKSGNSVIGNGASLELGSMNGDGVYQLIVSSNGCSSLPVSYTLQRQNLSSSYTIIGLDEVELGSDNKVGSGSIGVVSYKGKAEFKSNTNITAPGSFVKARNIDIDGRNVNISQIIRAAADNIVLPTMLYNTSYTKYLPKEQVRESDNRTLNGNYGDLQIKKGAVVTLNGNVFGSIKIEQGAQVTFTASTINIDKLEVVKGPRIGYSYIRFTQDANILVSNSVSIGSKVYVNPDNRRVTFYMGDNKKDDEKFSVKGGDTKVTANIFMPDGKLKVTGGYGYGDYGHGYGDCDRDDDDEKDYGKGDSYVYMTGLFIAEEVEGEGKNVIWNSFDCSASPVAVTAYHPSIVTGQTSTIEKTTAETSSEVDLKVTVMPNPSTTYFTLKFESKYTTPLSLRVMDANGRVVDAKSKVAANSTLQIGANYASGTYYAEILQGTARKVVQLIKVRG